MNGFKNKFAMMVTALFLIWIITLSVTSAYGVEIKGGEMITGGFISIETIVVQFYFRKNNGETKKTDKGCDK